MAESLNRKTAVELASLIASKAVSPVEVLDAHLAAIARVNPTLNAIVTLVADAARARAKAAETAVMRGDTPTRRRLTSPPPLSKAIDNSRYFTGVVTNPAEAR